MTYYKQHRDSNHCEISGHLRRIGYEVLELLKPLDLLVIKHGAAVFVEVKADNKADRYTRTQLTFISNTKFNVIITKTKEDADKKLRDRRYIQREDKDRLAALLALEKKDFFTPNEIEKILG